MAVGRSSSRIEAKCLTAMMFRQPVSHVSKFDSTLPIGPLAPNSRLLSVMVICQSLLVNDVLPPSPLTVGLEEFLLHFSYERSLRKMII